MTSRTIAAFLTSTVFLVACQTTTSDTSPTASGQLRVVGETGPASKVASELSSAGASAASSASGRVAGIQAFCSGNADVLAISSDLSNDERTTCKSLGVTWSAGQTRSGMITYVDYAQADSLYSLPIY